MVGGLYLRTLITNFFIISFLVKICCFLPAHMLSNLADTEHTDSCDMLSMYIADKVGLAAVKGMSQSCLFLHYITISPFSGHIDLVNGFRKEKLTFTVIKSCLRFDARVVLILREATTKQGVYQTLPGYNLQSSIIY